METESVNTSDAAVTPRDFVELRDDFSKIPNGEPSVEGHGFKGWPGDRQFLKHGTCVNF
jgi:hypothetical protein